ncbi:hypothetical protein BV898_16246 [Hypsibius exemplaris]|uniref:Uncharacterized protein n=1 Tax=Hypsibius exemplaris TaxID=2072580 RepID=A0A9X6NEH2_HYPEX|nr:hypothetical protein BV898_16246 [Hypsibius exemplaris]
MTAFITMTLCAILLSSISANLTGTSVNYNQSDFNGASFQDFNGTISQNSNGTSSQNFNTSSFQEINGTMSQDLNRTSFQNFNTSSFQEINGTMSQNPTWATVPFENVNGMLSANINWTSTNAIDLAAETAIANHSQIISETTAISLNQTVLLDGNLTVNRSSVSPTITSTAHSLSTSSSSRHGTDTSESGSGNGDHGLDIVDVFDDDEDSTVIFEGSGTIPHNHPTRVTVPLAADEKLSADEKLPAFSTPASDFDFSNAITISVTPHEPSAVSEPTEAPAHSSGSSSATVPLLSSSKLCCCMILLFTIFVGIESV